MCHTPCPISSRAPSSDLFVFVPLWAEISSRRPSGPVTLTGGASPLSTITTCSSAASWWSCLPSSSTCCGSDAFTGGCFAAGRPLRSGWRRAFPPRRLGAPYELDRRERTQEDWALKEKPFLPQGFFPLFLFGFIFPFPFGSLKQKPIPLSVNSAALEESRLALFCTQL